MNMKRNILSGRVRVGFLAVFMLTAAISTDTIAAESTGANISHQWSAPVAVIGNYQWTNLSIDKRSKRSNRSERWFGPTGWRAILSVEYASPFDKDGSAATSGSGAELALVTPSPQGLGFRLSLGWSGIDVNDDRNWAGDGLGAPLPPHLHVVDQKKSMDAFRTFLSLQYRTFPPQNVPNAPEFTVFGGIGFITHDMQIDMTVADDSTGRTYWYSDNKTSTTPALTLGCSGSVMFTPRVGMEASLSTDILLDEERGFTTDGMYGFNAMHDYDGSWAWRLGLILAF
jgi:hypothetical protein